MAKKYKKAPKNQQVPKESRNPRATIQALIVYLTGIILCKTLIVRLVSIVLIVAGLDDKKIALLVGCHRKTVKTLRTKLDTMTVAELLFIKPGSGRKPKASTDVVSGIVSAVKTKIFFNLRQIADYVYDTYKLKVSETCIGRMLKRFNIRRLKCGSIPAKADTEKQNLFYEAQFYPLVQQAKEGDIVLIFLDAAHCVMGNDYLGYVYGVVRRFIRTLSGRKRYNVLGALDFVTKQVHTITNTTYITAIQVCRMLAKLHKLYPGQEIHVILDNAKYQKCKIVTLLAKHLNIKLVYLPAYSPNLNLIERLWKYVKSELHKQSWKDFQAFRQRIDQIIVDFSGKNIAKANSLITENVQLFDDFVEVTDTVLEEPAKTRKAA